MMKQMVLTALTGALLVTAGTAVAQSTAAATASPAAPATAPAATSFTDADLKAYARAAIAASKIQQDAAVAPAEKQPKMLAALQAQGLDPVKFNAIATASQSDPALLQRIRDAAASDPTLSQPAPTAPAADSTPAPTTTP